MALLDLQVADGRSAFLVEQGGDLLVKPARCELLDVREAKVRARYPRLVGVKRVGLFLEDGEVDRAEDGGELIEAAALCGIGPDGVPALVVVDTEEERRARCERARGELDEPIEVLYRRKLLVDPCVGSR